MGLPAMGQNGRTDTIEFEINDEQLLAIKAGKLDIIITFKDGEIVVEEIRESRKRKRLPQGIRHTVVLVIQPCTTSNN